jgi:hypothetical protein
MTLLESPQARLLARLMSDLSEDYFCAGWLGGCEYALWADLTGAQVRGQKGWAISAEEKEELRVAHELAGGWIVWSDQVQGRAYLTTGEWLAHLACTNDSSPEQTKTLR